MKVSNKVIVASAVAALFASGAYAQDKEKSEKGKKAEGVMCAGVNECKGKSSCHTADNACKGQNACKGKGWQHMSEKECKTKGGKVAAANP